MSSTFVTKTRPVTRDKLAQTFQNHEMRVAFEDLTQDVGTTLPDAANELQAQIAAASAEVASLQAQVASLTLRVTALETEVEALQTYVSDAQGIADAAVSQLGVLRDAITGALSSIDDLRKGPNPL